ncbi:MAG: hypothetical protein HFH86_04535 [Bacilli bacterium]|nr:hypothetical protein [Bacilli bacterium]
MKLKILQIIVSIFFLFIPTFVNASDLLATFEYSFQEEGMDLSFMLDLYSDGTIVKEYKSGALFEGVNRIDYYGKGNSMDQFDQDVLAFSFKDGSYLNQAPDLYYCRDTKSRFYHIYTSSQICQVTQEEAILITPMVQLVRNETQSESFCNRSIMVHGKNARIRFFLDADGAKKFELTYDEQRTEGFLEDSVELSGRSFYFSEDIGNNFYRDAKSCEQSSLFVKEVGNDVYFTMERANSSNHNTSFHDESKGNEDINLAGLCYEPRVARTLKFLGILLFIVKVFVPFIIIVLGSIDFGKAMLSGKSDDVPKQVSVLVKRFLIGVVIFMMPSLIEFLFGVLDGYSETMARYHNCRVCILDPDECTIKSE